MNKSVKIYMIQDLVVLTLIGCLLEGLTSRFIGFALDCAPTVTISLLIVFIAVARWNLWGLIPIPLLAFATLLGGHFSDIPYFAALYSFSNWQLYLSVVLGLAGMGINVIFFKKFKTSSITGSIWKCLLLLALDYLVYCGLQFVFYRLFTTGGLSHQATIVYEYYTKDDVGNVVDSSKNLAFYGENGIVYNLYGLAVAVIGILVFRSQGVLNNAVEKLLSDKKEREAELEYLKSVGNGKKNRAEVKDSQDESNKKEDKDSSEN